MVGRRVDENGRSWYRRDDVARILGMDLLGAEEMDKDDMFGLLCRLSGEKWQKMRDIMRHLDLRCGADYTGRKVCMINHVLDFGTGAMSLRKQLEEYRLEVEEETMSRVERTLEDVERMIRDGYIREKDHRIKEKICLRLYCDLWNHWHIKVLEF